MRERTSLDNGINGLRDMEGELAEVIELIELGELEDDTEIVTEAEAQLAELSARAGRLRMESMLSARWMATTAMWKFMPGRAVPSPRTGPKCYFACTAGGAISVNSRANWWKPAPARKRA